MDARRCCGNGYIHTLAGARRSLAAYGSRLMLRHSDYRQLDEALDAEGIGAVDGLLADLGVSSMQLDSPGRGFSFRRAEPLGLRTDTTTGQTAADAIRDADERTLADVIYEYGED